MTIGQSCCESSHLGDDSRLHIDYAHRHLLFGWWSLLFFAILGLVLESLHAFKIPMYLDVSNETRRLTWTLAHAHGALLSLVHVVYGLCLRALPRLDSGRQRLVSSCLVGGSVLLPGGFFAGGIAFYSGDPGLGMVFVPVGATVFLIGVFLVARTIAALPRDARPESRARP